MQQEGQDHPTNTVIWGAGDVADEEPATVLWRTDKQEAKVTAIYFNKEALNCPPSAIANSESRQLISVNNKIDHVNLSQLREEPQTVINYSEPDKDEGAESTAKEGVNKEE